MTYEVWPRQRSTLECEDPSLIREARSQGGVGATQLTIAQGRGEQRIGRFDHQDPHPDPGFHNEDNIYCESQVNGRSLWH